MTIDAKRRKKQQGFTLIELLVVAAIIGLLTAISVGSYRSSIQKAKEAVLRENDGLAYHVCYATSCLEAALGSLKAAGNRLLCVSPPTEAVLFGGLEVSFYRASGFGLIEILEDRTAAPRCRGEQGADPRAPSADE